MRASEDLRQLELLLARPLDQRLREYKYRCAQSLVFGLPVVALQYIGTSLGGPEAPRFVAIIQMLLAGWVMYVGAAGMLVEGAILFEKGKFLWDLAVATCAIGMYFGSLVATGYVVVTGRGVFPIYHVPVMLIAIWTGIRWAACLYSVRHSDPRGE